MNKEKAAVLLGQGLTPSVVASVVGCSPAYMSQLMATEDFKLMVLANRTEAAKLPDDELITTKYVGMEHKLLQAMEQALPNAELPAITNALKVVAERQEKRASRLQAPQVAEAGRTQVVVQIAMPQTAMPHILLNEKKEVIAIDNRPMAPMASSAVQNMFAVKRAEREQALQQKALEETAPLRQPLRHLPQDF